MRCTMPCEASRRLGLCRVVFCCISKIAKFMTAVKKPSLACFFFVFFFSKIQYILARVSRVSLASESSLLAYYCITKFSYRIESIFVKGTAVRLYLTRLADSYSHSEYVIINLGFFTVLQFFLQNMQMYTFV